MPSAACPSTPAGSVLFHRERKITWYACEFPDRGVAIVQVMTTLIVRECRDMYGDHRRRALAQSLGTTTRTERWDACCQTSAQKHMQAPSRC